MTGSTLPEKVAQLYYTYGLFCSSYPISAITFALCVILICCYPLLNVPLLGNLPTVANLPINLNNVHTIDKLDCELKVGLDTDLSLYLNQILYNESQTLPFIWAKDKELLYIQQIIIKIGVFPWRNDLKMWDAFRSPLRESFRLLETVRNHRDPESKSTLSELCYQIEAVKRKNSMADIEHVFPEYDCLILSPANLWQQSLQTFNLDANLINTIYYHQKGKTSIADMVFGMPLRETGIKRYPRRARPRVLQYAVTIFYRKAQYSFMKTLANRLQLMYPLHRDSPYAHVNEVTLIYYPSQFNFGELVPLMITFFGIFLYVYFSVRKIEFIKSKLGLAACAVMTIAGSLMMSMGIYFYSGFSLSLQGKEIFPYLVIIVGLENVLVLTKSVTSTDTRLDVKIRLAQGLSKEGWSITKNLLIEITILTVSFFTFVPFIQEFAIFLIISLLSDYFIQIVFFATALGISVQRMECFQDQNSNLHLKDYFSSNNALNWRLNNNFDDKSESPIRMIKSKSHPRLNGLAQQSPTDILAKAQTNSGGTDNRVPKRIRLVNMWARTRFFQRAFMVWMLVWISIIVYNSGVVDYFIGNTDKNDNNERKRNITENEKVQTIYTFHNSNESNPLIFSPLLEQSSQKTEEFSNDTVFLKQSSHSRHWNTLSPYHWSSILSQYNETLAGRMVVVLPPVLLSHRVSPDVAVAVRHPHEKEPPLLRWQTLAAALDPIDILPDFELNKGKSQQHQWGTSELPIYPTTPMEILLLAILCSISVAVIAYMMVVLYRCVCTRNYAEWRTSWNDDEHIQRIIAKQPAVQLVMEAFPVVLAGHSQEVECVVTDGERVVSSCLQGTIKVWDSQHGELITEIDRNAFFDRQQDTIPENTSEDSVGYQPVKVPEETTNHIEISHNFQHELNDYLSGLRFRSRDPLSSHVRAAEETKNEFAKIHRYLYGTDKSVNISSVETNENIDPIVTKIIRKENESNSLHRKKNERIKCFQLNNSETSVNTLRIGNTSKTNCDKKDSVSNSDNAEVGNFDWRKNTLNTSPLWCMDFCNDLILIGCADGRLEFWEASSGKLMSVWCCAQSYSHSAGITHVRLLSGARSAVVGSLSGHLTLLRLDAYNATSGTHVDWRFSTAHSRYHKRNGACSLHNPMGLESPAGTMNFTDEALPTDVDELVCVQLAYCRAHLQPITELHAEGGRVLTGGQDHVLKVFTSSELTALFTLHGHSGPITSCFIDRSTPTIAGSGSQDGSLCVWDLHTGACLYSTQAHDGSVTSLAYTASYVVSAGSDERLCIWDRFQGHLLNNIHIGLNFLSRMLPLTHTLLLMGDKNGLIVYDLSSGDKIRRVIFGQCDGCIFVRQILPLKDAIVCDYANQLRIVKFPLVTQLSDTKNK